MCTKFMYDDILPSSSLNIIGGVTIWAEPMLNQIEFSENSTGLIAVQEINGDIFIGVNDFTDENVSIVEEIYYKFTNK